MIRFLHTADWHLGRRATFAQDLGDRLRAARLDAVDRALGYAREFDVDFMVVAGDVFDSGLVESELVHRVLDRLASVAPRVVFLLPGNHDPLGPGSVYDRAAFRRPPANVVVFRSREPVALEPQEVVLLPSPVSQKRTAVDPTSLMARVPGGDLRIRIGVAHGSLAVPGRHEGDDHPIALDAASRLALDYLALGHLHGKCVHDGRVVYPGTIEPTAFGEDSGWAAVVTIGGAGCSPSMNWVRCGTLRWELRDVSVGENAGAVLEEVRRDYDGLEEPGKTLVRLRLEGVLPPVLEPLLVDLEARLRARFLHVDVDRKRLQHEIEGGEWLERLRAHPFLVGIVEDLAAMRSGSWKNGNGPVAGAASADAAVVDEALRLLGIYLAESLS